VALPTAGDGVLLHERSVCRIGSKHRVEAAHHPVAVARDVKRLRPLLEPQASSRGSFGCFMHRGEPFDRGVVIPAAHHLDSVLRAAAREERLSNNGVLEDVDDVCRVAPELLDTRGPDLISQLLPGTAA
jgi:hypothetical protein